MQNLYETLLIVTPEADDERVSAVIGDLRTTIENDDGTVLQAGVWQRRKLAYAVMGKTEGIYLLIYADGDRTLPAALKDRMKLDESVIRSMVVRLEGLHERDVRTQLAEADHTGEVAEIEAQQAAAEKRHDAEAAAAAMSLDEIAAAEAAEASEAADVAEAAEEGEAADAAEAAEDAEEGEAADAAEAAEDAEEGKAEDAAEAAATGEETEEAPAGESAAADPAPQDPAPQAAADATDEPQPAAEVADDAQDEPGDDESGEDEQKEG